MIKIGGIPFLDGGCSCKIPYRWALKQWFKKIVVIKTREPEFRKEDKISKLAIEAYRKYPKFATRLAYSSIHYNRQCDEIERLHESGRIMRFAPTEKVTVSRVERNVEKLGALYWLGWNNCNNQLVVLRKYLEIS